MPKSTEAWEPTEDNTLPDACFDIWLSATHGQRGVNVESKQLIMMIRELRWHRKAKVEEIGRQQDAARHGPRWAEVIIAAADHAKKAKKKKAKR